MISDWYTDEYGNRCRTVTAEDTYELADRQILMAKRDELIREWRALENTVWGLSRAIEILAGEATP